MTVMSKLLNKQDEEMAKFLMKQEEIFPPPIPYKSKSKRGKLISRKNSADKQEKAKAKLNIHTATLQYDNTEDSGTYQHDIEKFSNGSAEDWVLFREDFDDLLDRMHYNDPEDDTDYGASKLNVLKAIKFYTLTMRYLSITTIAIYGV